MRDRYRLSGLRDDELLGKLSGLVKTGNALNADALAHLAELDERRLYLELGFSSLFAYCVESLGMDESSAGRRITAARVCRRFPAVFERVASGALSLSALCALNPHLNPENAEGLFEASRNKSRRWVEEMLAARFPKPDVRDLIRRMPPKAELRPSLAATTEPNILPTWISIPIPTPTPTPLPTPTSTSAPAPIELRRTSGKPIDGPQRRIEPLSLDRYGFHFTGDSSLKEKFERARALLSHELPRGEMSALFELALDALLLDREKRRFSVVRKPRQWVRPHSPGECGRKEPNEASVQSAGASPQSKSERSRHIPAAVVREVYGRDDGQCCFVARNGRRCNSRVFLEIDHIQPFAAGGPAVVENLRLMCRAHNQWHALRYFGRERIKAARSRSSSARVQRNGEAAAPDTDIQSAGKREPNCVPVVGRGFRSPGSVQVDEVS